MVEGQCSNTIGPQASIQEATIRYELLTYGKAFNCPQLDRMKVATAQKCLAQEGDCLSSGQRQTTYVDSDSLAALQAGYACVS